MSAAATKLSLGVGGESTGAPVGQDPKNPQRDNKVKRMGTGSIPRLLLEFAIPAIAGMMVNGAYNIIDAHFLGEAMGEVGLSAMTVANPIMIVFLAIAMMIGAGGNALAALKMGEKKRVDAEISLGNTVTLSLVISVIVALVAASPVALDALVTLSSATDEIRPYATSFIRILCFGFIFQCIGFGVNNFIRTAGAPIYALITMVIGAVFCTLFNFIFVTHLGWGVEGSALATIFGQAVSCVAVLWYFIFPKNVPLKLHVRYMRPYLNVIKAIAALGAASFFVQAGAAVTSFLVNHLLVVYGALTPLGAENALATIGVVQRIALFTIFPLIGVAIAAQPLLGFNYGARLISRVRKTLGYAIIGAVIIGTIMWLIIHLFPEAIVGFFGLEDGRLLDFTVFALKIQMMMLPVIGFQIVGSNYFQATGQPLKSVILTLTRQIIFLVPLLIILPEMLPSVMVELNGLDAIYFAAPVADTLSIFTVGIFMLYELRRLKMLEKGEIQGKSWADNSTKGI